MDDLVAKALHAARQHFDEGGFLDSLRGMFSGPDYQSTGEVASPTNWGDPDSAADFFRADKAMRLAQQASEPEAPLTAPRPGAVETRELPARQPIASPPPAPTQIPFAAPDRGVTMSGSGPATIASQPLAYTAAPAPAPAQAAITSAMPGGAKFENRIDPNAIDERAENVWSRMLRQESGNRQFRPNGSVVTSPKGALGISQVMPSTGPEAAKYAGLPWSLERLRNDPEYNHALGRAYYDAQVERFGDPTLAAAAYNGGPGRVASALRQARETGQPWTAFLKPETQHYVRVVGRAEGGLVDDALHVVREHHADGEAVGQGPFFTFEPTPDSVDRQAARQPAYNPAERTWSDAGSTEGERLTRALGVEGGLPTGETFMSPQPSGWDKYMPQRVPGTFLKRTGEAFNENADAVSEGLKAVREGNYGAGALGMVGGALGAAISPLTGMERVLVRDPYLRMTGNLKDAQAAEMVADAALTGGMRGPAKQLLGRGIEGMATDPWAKMRLPSPAATGAATAAGAMLAPEDAEAGNVDRILRGLRAYHGSPYKFDRFDLSKIGAGEGAQAFGHGLYFAEHEPTAKYYRDTLAHKGAIDLEQAAHERGLPLSIDAQREIRRQASGSMEPLAAAKWAQSANSEMRPFDPEKLADLIDTYRQSRTGHMYEVNIDADPERLLNWDKPLREQSPDVRDVLASHLASKSEEMANRSGFQNFKSNPQNFMDVGGHTFRPMNSVMSKDLESLGIPGIKYLDAGSLNATGIPTHNYVIFNDKLIDINRRYADGGQIPEGNDMRDHFEGGGLTSAALKLVRKAAPKTSSKPFLSPKQPVDATLGKASANVMFRGKDPANWSPQDWHDFGKQYGVNNLGPANEREWAASLVPHKTISGRDVTLPPGGYESKDPLTYYDLLHLKAQGINPNDLPPEVHQGIHNRMIRTMQPGEGGPSNEQITNQTIFGLISPNQPLTPNELALQRAMVKGPKDLEAWGSMIPYRYTEGAPPIAERQAMSREITPQLGLHAAERGGIGASGSANYTDIAEFAQKMKDRPDFFRFNPNDPSMEGMSDSEKWATHVGRLMNEVRGLKAKTGSLASVWQSPEDAAISAIDRHMATKFRGDMFPSPEAKAAWEANAIDKFNTARPDTPVSSINEMLEAPGGRGHFVDNALAYVNNLPAAQTRIARTGEYNPSIPRGLRDVDWPGGEPKKMEMVAGPYVRALEANAEEAKNAGQGLFSNQWMLWDRIRNRLEPHEILFPGLENLPRMSLDQMKRVTRDLSDAGYMAAEGAARPLPSASRAGYFAIPPAVAGGAAAMAVPDDAAAAEAPVAEAPMTEERKRGGSVVDRALMLVSRQA